MTRPAQATGLASIRADVTRRLLIIAALLGLVAASCADLPEAEVSFGEGVRFVPMVADATDNVGLGNALAVDAEGNPYLSYFGIPSEEGGVTAARPINSAFLPAVQLTTVSDGIFVRGAVAQVQDPPAPAYVVPFGPETVEDLEGLRADAAAGTALAIADDGERHVAWAAAGSVWYGAAGAEGSFSVEEVDASADAGPPSIALDGSGNPWIAYEAATDAGVEVRVASSASGAWEVQTAAAIGACPDCPAGTAIVVRGGAPAVLWADPGGGIAQAVLAGTTWQVRTAVPDVEATGLAAASNDTDAYVTYYADGAFRLAASTGSASWTSSEVAPADLGADAAEAGTSIALDEEGLIYVAWQDGEAVRMARGEPDGLEELETQDTEGGTMPSIAATADGATVYLSWYDPESQDLLLGMFGEVGDLVLANPSPIPPPSPAAGGAEGCGEDGEIVLDIIAENIAFDPTCLVAPAGEPFSITFENLDDGIPHNVSVLTEQNGDEIFREPPFPGVETVQYDLDPLDPGNYFFICDVHPNMTGTLAAIEGGAGGGGGGGGGENGGGGGGGGGAGVPVATDAPPSP